MVIKVAKYTKQKMSSKRIPVSKATGKPVHVRSLISEHGDKVTISQTFSVQTPAGPETYKKGDSWDQKDFWGSWNYSDKKPYNIKN
jgi:hypothetical protein